MMAQIQPDHLKNRGSGPEYDIIIQYNYNFGLHATCSTYSYVYSYINAGYTYRPI